MLFNKENPKGIDYGIKLLQDDLFVQLIKAGWRDYDSYDRAYANRKGADKVPEVYKTKGDYKEVLFNDKETVTSFFLADEKRTADNEKNLFYQGISIVFQANLKKLYPDIVHRADEEMINDITLAINKKYWGNRLTEIITGIDKVYDSLKINYNKKDFADLSNFCIVRFNFKMSYSNPKTDQIIFLK